MNKNQRVYAKVDLDALLSNVEQIKGRLKENTKIVAVMKADGYGHGCLPIALTLEEVPYVWGFAIATAEEAMELREAGIKKPILILGYSFEDSYEELVKNDICPTIISMEMAKKYSEVGKRLNKDVNCHIKIDTGMSRIGYQVNEDSVKEIKEIAALPHLKMDGIFTHFARSDEKDKTFTTKQFDAFETMISNLENAGVTFKNHHCANSAAILEYPDASLDLARAGIILYGLWPSDEVKRDIKLRPVLSLYSHVVHVKTLPKGRTISYGGTVTLEKDTKIATIPVGYADGYCRGLSSVGYVLIRGKKAPILGRVCMDQFMVDVSDISDVEVMDLVTLIGKDHDKEITLEDLGELSGRFNYEFACDLGMRIPRLYYKDGKLVDIKGYHSFDQM